MSSTEKVAEQISQETYLKNFSGEKRDKALTQALDIRKFEIEMYWKRATYFWTLIAATLAGYAAVRAGEKIQDREFLSVVLSSLGLLFAFAWYCVNRGSKQWQENWENQVDMLEDGVIGPLYKTILRRPKPSGAIEHLANFISGPHPFSVSGINQIISLYVVFLWIALLWLSLPSFASGGAFPWKYFFIVGFSVASCVMFMVIGRTYQGDHQNSANLRKAMIYVSEVINEKDAKV